MRAEDIRKVSEAQGGLRGITPAISCDQAMELFDDFDQPLNDQQIDQLAAHLIGCPGCAETLILVGDYAFGSPPEGDSE